jgi:hypothetical protein
LDIGTTLQPVLLAPRGLADLVSLQSLVRVVLDRLARLGIDTVRPVDLLRVLRGREELPVVAVERIKKAVAAEMRNDVAILAVHLCVDQLIDPDLVVIEEVTRRILEIPDDFSGAGIHASSLMQVRCGRPGCG